MINPIKASVNLLIGMFTVFKHLFKKPVTLEYPEKHRELNDYFRGKMTVNNSICVGCGICKKVCPAGAIDYIKDENGKIVSYNFNLEKCIFCGNCQYYCPNHAIKMIKEYELASTDKKDLQLNYKLDNYEQVKND